jgi:hypothetical protein
VVGKEKAWASRKKVVNEYTTEKYPPSEILSDDVKATHPSLDKVQHTYKR